MLFARASARAADAFAQDEILPVSTRAENGKQPGNDQSDSDIRSPISTYKINYFALDNLPNNDNAQVKFQLSVKYKLFERGISVGGRPLALYLAYSQISLWNVCQSSKPFEESNYNPEAFLNYSANITRGSVALRDIILSPYEHESIGLAGPQSRSWQCLCGSPHGFLANGETLR